MRTFFLIVVTLLFGIALGGLFFGYYQDYVIDYTLQLGVSLLWGAIGVTLVFVLGFTFLDRFAKRKLGVDNYSATTIARRMNTLLWDALNLNRAAAQRTSEKLVAEIVSYVSIFMFYRWVFAIFLTIVGTIGGTLGTIVLVKQNEKIGEQTEVAREQAAIAVQQFIRMKSDELELIARKIADLRRPLTPQDIKDLSRLYRRSGESPCWSKTGDATSAIPKSIDALDPGIRTDVELLASLVLLALEGASDNRPHHKSFRASLLRLLASSNLPFSIFGQGAFKELTLDAGNFKGANFDDVTLVKVTLRSPALFQGLCATGLATVQLKADHVDFSNSVLINVKLGEAQLDYSKFRNTVIKSSITYGFYEDYAIFYPEPRGTVAFLKSLLARTQKALGFSVPSKGGFITPELAPIFDFEGASLVGADFRDAVIENISFENASLEETKFQGARISGRTSFKGAKLTNSDFRLHSLSTKELPSVDFTDAVMTNAAVDDLNFGENKTLTEKQLLGACTCSGSSPILMGKKVVVGSCQSFHYTGWIGGSKVFVCEARSGE